MPQTPREIITLVIVSVLLCGAIVYVAKLFPQARHLQEYAPTTAAKQLSTPSDPPALAAHQPRVAPDGVFFLTERVALTSASGVIGLAPGAGVRLVSRNGDTFRVTDGQTTFDVSKEKLTNDVDEAAVLTGKDFASQKAIAAHIGSEIELHRQRANAENAQQERDLNAIEAARREAQRIAAENMITPAEAEILNLREVRHDMNGYIIYGWATDGISVGPGKVRSFREQAELVKAHRLPELTSDERREREREDYIFTQQHKTPDTIVIQQH